MKAKEKAKELVDKFYPRATSYSLDRKNQNDNAKQCALIAVNEILTLDIYQSEQWYWEEVKQEIEKDSKLEEQETIEEVFEWLTTNNYLTDLKETLIEDFNKFKNK